MTYRSLTPSPLGDVHFAGYHVRRPHVPPKTPHPIDCRALAYVVEGYSRYQDESGLQQELRPGDLLLLYPRLSLAYYHLPEKGPWSEFYIVFEGALFDLWQEKGILNPRRPIHHLEPMEYWLRRFEAVIEPDPNLNQDDSLTRICRLQLALGDALAYERQHGDARADWEWLRQAMLAIEQHSQGLRTDWKKVAWQMKMSYERFRKKFVQVAGYTPSTYRLRHVLDQASERLREPGTTVKEVADRCGFSDSFHFSRRFKEVLGISPTEYQRRFGNGTA